MSLLLLLLRYGISEVQAHAALTNSHCFCASDGIATRTCSHSMLCIHILYCVVLLLVYCLQAAGRTPSKACLDALAAACRLSGKRELYNSAIAPLLAKLATSQSASERLTGTCSAPQLKLYNVRLACLHALKRSGCIHLLIHSRNATATIVKRFCSLVLHIGPLYTNLTRSIC
jgi:hypothetical protein